MLCCFNPSCPEIQNPDGQNFCASCGSPLLLKERYQAVKLLGSGGFGRTFQSVDTAPFGSNPKKCAIKQLYLPSTASSAKQKILELFERESQWLYQLEDYPQIPKFIDYFSERDNLYLIQELIEGKTLSQEVKERQTPFQEEDVFSFLKEVILILKYIHQYKIIHRDIKPDNLIRRDSDQKWVLIDFGASRILSETALMGGATIIGTPEYMAPEQHRGKVLPASDIYSLGIICVQLLTGQSTLEMLDIQTNTWNWQKYLPREIQLSAPFIKLINNMIAPSLGDRLQSALQVEQALKQLERRKNSTKFNSIPPSAPTFLAKIKALDPRHQATVPMNLDPDLKLTISIPQLSNNSANGDVQSVLDFQLLIQNLQKKRWQAADDETWYLINQAIAKTRHQFLFVRDLPLIPCDLLLGIDQLWRQYSHDRFGFSKQLEIYQAVNGDYPQFCQQVGWSLEGSSRPEIELSFHTEAPIGHLPSRQKMGGTSLWKNMQAFYERLMECGF